MYGSHIIDVVGMMGEEGSFIKMGEHYIKYNGQEHGSFENRKLWSQLKETLGEGKSVSW